MFIQHTQVFVDNNTPLKNVRRRKLEEMAKKHGIPVSADTSAVSLRKMLSELNIQPDSEPEVAPEDLESMSLFQLRNVCKSRNVQWAKTDKKTDLLRKLS